MVAVLKPITARPAAPPAYDNTCVERFISWSGANDKLLREYYVAIGGHLPNPTKDGHLRADGDAYRYLQFVTTQWKRARGDFL
jgi:hypothetical protein